MIKVNYSVGPTIIKPEPKVLMGKESVLIKAKLTPSCVLATIRDVRTGEVVNLNLDIEDLHKRYEEMRRSEALYNEVIIQYLVDPRNSVSIDAGNVLKHELIYIRATDMFHIMEPGFNDHPLIRQHMEAVQNLKESPRSQMASSFTYDYRYISDVIQQSKTLKIKHSRGRTEHIERYTYTQIREFLREFGNKAQKAGGAIRRLRSGNLKPTKLSLYILYKDGEVFAAIFTYVVKDMGYSYLLAPKSVHVYTRTLADLNLKDSIKHIALK